MEGKTMKKTLSLVLALIMCLSALSLCVFADDVTSATAKEAVVLSGKALYDAKYKCPETTATFSYNEEGGYSTLTGATDAANAEQVYFNLPNEISGADYPIMVIKYRYDKSYAKAGLSVFRSDFTAVDTNHGNATGTVSNRSKDGDIKTVADGEWQTKVIDMTELSFEATRCDLSGGNDRQYLDSLAGKSWSNFSYGKIGLVPYGWNAIKDSKFDVEYIGFFTSADEANKYVNGVAGIIIDSYSDMHSTSSDTTVTYDNDGGFLHFAYKTGGGAGYIGAKFNAPTDFSGSAYKYMAIKYRYDKEYDKAGISIYRNDITGNDANNNNVSYKISSRSKDGQIATVDDGQWQTAVIDMSSIEFEEQQYDRTNYPGVKVGGGKSWGDYTYKQLSILPFGWNRPEGASFDLEYVAFFKTEEEAKAYAGIPVYEDNAEGYTYDAARLELVYKMNETASWNASVKASADESYVTLTSNQTSGPKAARLYIPLGDGFDLNANKYFAIKYRYKDNKLTADMQLMRAIKSDASNALSRVKDGSFGTVTDGDGWQTIVIDLTTVEFDNELFIGKTWTEHALNGIYLMPWGGVATNGANVDIAVLGFSDTENNARAIVGLEPVSAEENQTPDDGENGNSENVNGAPADTTAPDTDTDTNTDTDTEATEEKKKGCRSSLALGGTAAVISVSAAAVTLFRKKKYDC